MVGILKEVAIYIYMLAVKITGCLARIFPVKQKVVLLVSFPENSTAIIKQMNEMKVTPKTVVFYDPRVDVTGFNFDFIQLKPTKNQALYLVNVPSEYGKSCHYG